MAELLAVLLHPELADPGHDNPVLKGGLYCTWHTDPVTKARYPTYVRALFFGMSGAINQDPKRVNVPLGQIHPNCLRCNRQDYCAQMCPLPEDVPGFTCTAEMDFEEQEAGWLR